MIISGRELHDYAMAAAKEWNHGVVPEPDIVEGFLSNAILSNEVLGVVVIKKGLRIVKDEQK